MSRQPIYVPPDAIHKEIPKRWAKNMEALAAVMREIPDEVAEEDVAQEWMERFEEVSAQIEELRKFAANMSAEVPEYPEDTEEAIGSGFLTLVALRNWFPRDATKSKSKPAPGAAARPKVGGEVRRSQHQLEKAAMTDEGPKDTTRTADSVAVEVTAAAPRKVPAAMQEPVIVVDNQTKAMQELGGGVKSTAQALQGTDKPCERCVKRGVLCVWRDGGACELCHEGKKKCNKAGKAGRKRKNVEGPPALSATTSKKPRTSPVPPPPATSSAPPQMTIRIRPRLVGRPVTLQGTSASASAAAPPNLEFPPTTPSLSQPPPPLFLPLSPMNTPVPSTSRTEVEPQDDPSTFAASLGGLLDEAPGGEFEADRSGDDGDLETPRVSVEGEDDVGDPPQGSAEARWTPFSGTPHAVAQYDARLAAALGTVEWAESLMAELHSGMGQLGLVIQWAKRDIRQLQEWQ
ncbi:hypothetical protein PISMIDRAFT_14833 [Pisolithus microcarpus 441]|uniref:Uncharacterized protein n=1 Tax=Pisolithus microcarpus 441 TaxID=765257 RepID=A0A0C9YUS2_9AGAM|nr:hypothetical protein PISMIDRAFT_14833 [Pisolithus microcarpus 441]